MEGPLLLGGHWVWRDRQEDVQVLFAGRGPDLSPDRDQVLQRIVPGAPAVAWAKQIHSARVLPAAPGACGEADALVGDAGLVLSVVTADCVPVLLAGPGGLAAVHAGWRGIVGGVVPATLASLVPSPEPQAKGSFPLGGGGLEKGEGQDGGGLNEGNLSGGSPHLDPPPVPTLPLPGGGRPLPTASGSGSPPLHRWTAWIGPSIGPCCYEVGEDVAEQVAAASGPEVVFPGVHPGQRPHLDLIAAVRRQLEAAGIGAVRALSHCTRCDAERLWSYRRDGNGAGSAGRNLAFIWRGE